MITIVRGPRSSLFSHPAIVGAAQAGEPVFLLEASEEFSVPWEGARRLLGQLRACLGDAAVEQAAAPHHALLSLVLRGLVERLTPEEREERVRASGLYLGALPNTSLDPRPLVEAWVGLLSPLLMSCRAVLVVPEIGRLDPESAVLIRPLLSRCGDGLHLILGRDPAWQPRDSLSGYSLAFIEGSLLQLEALPGVTLERLPECSSALSFTEPVGKRDLWDDGLERAAWHALTVEEGVLAPSARERALSGLRAAFSGFGFSAALRLAEELLAREPSLPEAAEVHTLAALSAHNFFISEQDKGALLARVERHASLALAREEDPERRAHLLYRLSLCASRGARPFEEALLLADQAITLAQGGALCARRAPFFEAWARNSRALALFRQKRGEEAAFECARAEELLRESAARLDIPLAEVAITRWNLCNNLARLALLRGDRQGALGWLGRCEEREEEIPPWQRPPYGPVAMQLASADLATARRRFAARLDEARAALSPSLEASYAHALGDISYRLGDARAAYEHFSTALRLWRALRHEEEAIATEEMNCAVSAFRAGLFREAEEGFERLLSHPLLDDPGSQAELTGALAMVAARQGEEALALARGRAAQKAAAFVDEEVAGRVSRSLGEMYLLLGRPQEARPCFQDALMREEAPLPAEDQLGALTGLLRCGDEDPALLQQALALAPEALEDVNAWWDLAALLPPLARAAEQDSFWGEGQEAKARQGAARRLVEAALQRQDCREAAERLSGYLLS